MTWQIAARSPESASCISLSLNSISSGLPLTTINVEKVKLRLVSYVYGDSLKAANGRCISTQGELDRLFAHYPDDPAVN